MVIKKFVPMYVCMHIQYVFICLYVCMYVLYVLLFVISGSLDEETFETIQKQLLSRETLYEMGAVGSLASSPSIGYGHRLTHMHTYSTYTHTYKHTCIHTYIRKRKKSFIVSYE